MKSDDSQNTSMGNMSRADFIKHCKAKAIAISQEPDNYNRRKLRAAVPKHERLYVFHYLDQIAINKRNNNAHRYMWNAAN